MPAIARINWNGSQAVIIEADGRIFTIDQEDAPPQEQSSGFHQGMYLQPSMNEIEVRSAGEYPYSEIHEEVKKSYARQKGLRMFLYSIDADLTLELRRDAVKFSEEFLSFPDVKAHVLELILNTPFNSAASVTFDGIPTEGNFGEVLAVARKKWGL